MMNDRGAQLPPASHKTLEKSEFGCGEWAAFDRRLSPGGRQQGRHDDDAQGTKIWQPEPNTPEIRALRIPSTSKRGLEARSAANNNVALPRA